MPDEKPGNFDQKIQPPAKWSFQEWIGQHRRPIRCMFQKSLIDDLLCGVCGWTPQWLQRFRTMKVFLMCYVLLGIFHGMYGSYLSVVIPSVEKRFGLSSKQTGIYRAMADVSQISSSLLVAHYGGAGHRPRWIGAGAITLSVGMFLMAAPELIFPLPLMVAKGIRSANDKEEKFCAATPTNLSSVSQKPICTAKISASESSMGPLAVLGVAEFLMGLGATTIMILALPFIDDNVTARNTPLYFAMSFVGRLLGPLFGFGLGAICSSIFYDFSHPNFATNDPRWIAAWWLGLLVCASGIVLAGLFITCFPSVVRDPSASCKDFCEFDAKRRASVMRKQTTFKHFFPNLKRLVSNLPFMVKLLCQLLEGLVISGYMSFLMKFIKEQYRVSQSTASLATGIPGVLVASIGIMVGSFIIKRFRMEPRHVQLMTALAAIIGAISYYIVIGFGCENQNIIGIDDVEDPYNLTDPDLCFNKRSCGCYAGQFNPVCDLNTGQSYASACVAGCAKSIKGKIKTYANCACLLNTTTDFAQPDLNRTGNGTNIVAGLCQAPCNAFVPYIIVMCLAKFFLGIPLAGVVMIQFRLVEYDLKSLANGLSSVVMSLFGFLPAPIIAGAIIDTTCRYWQKSPCGGTGACFFYNTEGFRWKLHLIVACFKVVTCVFDLVIAWLIWDMKFDRTAAEVKAKVPVELPEVPSHPELAEKKNTESHDRVRTVTILEPVVEEDSEPSTNQDGVSADSAIEQTPSPSRFRTRTAHSRPISPLNPPDHRVRGPTMAGFAGFMNSKALTEKQEDTEYLAETTRNLRRGSLLY